MLPKSGTDEALLPMAMGQALVWKQWEDKGTTYHNDAELAQRLQAEQDREDARKRAEARQAAEARSSARGPSTSTSTAVSDAQLARMLQEAERSGAAAPRPAATTLNAQGLTDAEIAAVLQEEEEAMARARLRRNQRTNY
ncbi:uncharacterized protein ACA1_008730 [Acanthamoeba castellanii str. Neff]|uniref:Uncharacterized protein n=1 Tax=Acanthamoeba castellanii (strain ATCC 30010 / Neff) TaxID=1257118 RepID=L8HED6_ACACF|nr:uncharacterized protein ACA1_008730 [Acanthamoeba castellanii str. Neff]ELR23108.1 hypothetical protein ACA1_008730 [Acanthamoeba castellanii str. Neff]